jgi:hypothetical protein
MLETHRTVVERGPADGDRREAGGLWASGLHIAHAVPRAAIVHIYGGSRWVGSGKSSTCAGRVGGSRRSEALRCRRRGLVVVHHCKGNREVGLWWCCLVGSGWLRPTGTRRPCRNTTHSWSRPRPLALSLIRVCEMWVGTKSSTTATAFATGQGRGGAN